MRSGDWLTHQSKWCLMIGWRQNIKRLLLFCKKLKNYLGDAASLSLSLSFSLPLSLTRVNSFKCRVIFKGSDERRAAPFLFISFSLTALATSKLSFCIFFNPSIHCVYFFISFGDDGPVQERHFLSNARSVNLFVTPSCRSHFSKF